MQKTGLKPKSAIRKIVDKPFQFLRLFVFSIAMSVITLYVFLNSFALLFNVSIPYVVAVNYAQSSTILDNLALGKSISETGDQYKALGKERRFTVMRIPKLNIRMDIVQAVKTDGGWMYRPNSGHYFFLNQDNTSVPQFLVVYGMKSWRSINNPSDIQVGDNLYLQKDDQSNSLFRIVEKKLIPSNSNYVPSQSDTLGLVFLIDDTESKSTYVFKANYIDISNISNLAN